MKKFLLSLFACVAALGMNAQTNLLENGDFETWVDGKPVNWKSASTVSNATLTQSTDSKEGDYAAEAAWGGAKNNKRVAYKELNLKAGSYTFFYNVKSVDPDGLAVIAPGYVQVENGVASSNYNYRLVEGSEKDILYTEVHAEDWMSESFSFILDHPTTICLVLMVHKSGHGNVLIDDASLTTDNGGIDYSVVEETYEPMGQGTLENPYTIEDVKGLCGKTYAPTEPVWVKGPIAGSASSATALKPADANVASNIALGSSDAFVPVELPGKTSVRTALNLVDNPDNVDKEVWVYGTITTYFSTAGIKGTSDWSFDGKTTSISSIATDTKNAVIYDLSGRRVNRAENGVFIVNGKKVIR